MVQVSQAATAWDLFVYRPARNPAMWLENVFLDVAGIQKHQDTLRGSPQLKAQGQNSEMLQQCHGSFTHMLINI